MDTDWDEDHVGHVTIVRKSKRKDAQYESTVKETVDEDPLDLRPNLRMGLSEKAKKNIGFMARLKRDRRKQYS